MNSWLLYRLGRQLMTLAEDSFVAQNPEQRLPPGVRMILVDIGTHEGSSIGEIVARTGLPQSHVSATVAAFRERGLVETATDPRDARRTLVSGTARFRELAHERRNISADDVLLDALAHDAQAQQEVTAALDVLVHRLLPPAAAR